MRISLIRHPDYTDNETDYLKWRLTAKGGRGFIAQYLTRFSNREDSDSFKERTAMSYCPAFAKAGINKLKNTFYSRMSEIFRIDGPQNYQDAVAGKDGGVDLYGCSMNSFMGQTILFELMTMKRVGIFIDKPNLDGNLLAANAKKRPYLYYYCTEDILTWDYIYESGEYTYTNLLLRDTEYEIDPKTGLVTGTYEKYRHIWLSKDDGKVHIQMYLPNTQAKPNEEPVDTPLGPEVILDLKRIPFVLLELQESLLADVADYQIGMLNIASADMNYCFKANFPFYTEQYNPAAESIYTRGIGRPPISNIDPTTNKAPEEGTRAPAQRSNDADEIKVGAMRGRRYPTNTDRPDFIAPPTEPLLASIKKQEQMKQEIFELIDIAASNAQPTHASAESKQLDDRGLESGLSYIGLELEYGEREIAKIWGMYENADPATVNYPTKYTLKSDGQKVAESKTLGEIKSAAPSRTFSKEVSKLIANTMLGDKCKPETLQIIYKEIDAANFVTSDPDTIKMAQEGGMVSAVTGSNALGFNGEKEVPIAQEEHQKRVAAIAMSQAAGLGAARGNPDASPNPNKDAALEKKPIPDLNGAAK